MADKTDFCSWQTTVNYHNDSRIDEENEQRYYNSSCLCSFALELTFTDFTLANEDRRWTRFARIFAGLCLLIVRASLDHLSLLLTWEIQTFVTCNVMRGRRCLFSFLHLNIPRVDFPLEVSSNLSVILENQIRFTYDARWLTRGRSSFCLRLKCV